MKKIKVTIQAKISENIKKVWNYYTKPEHIIKWNFASDDWCCPSAENDLRPGGKIKLRMEAKDGSFGFDFEGVYDKVVYLNNISYTILDGRQVVIDFIKEDDKTKVTIMFDAESQNPVEMQRDGWQAILNNFRKYTEGS